MGKLEGCVPPHARRFIINATYSDVLGQWDHVSAARQTMYTRVEDVIEDRRQRRCVPRQIYDCVLTGDKRFNPSESWLSNEGLESFVLRVETFSST